MKRDKHRDFSVYTVRTSGKYGIRYCKNLIQEFDFRPCSKVPSHFNGNFESYLSELLQQYFSYYIYGLTSSTVDPSESETINLLKDITDKSEYLRAISSKMNSSHRLSICRYSNLDLKALEDIQRLLSELHLGAKKALELSPLPKRGETVKSGPLYNLIGNLNSIYTSHTLHLKRPKKKTCFIENNLSYLDIHFTENTIKDAIKHLNKGGR